MPDREETHIPDDVLQSIQEEDDPDEERQVVVPGHHVLRAQIHERADRGALNRLQEHRVLPGHAMCARLRHEDEGQQNERQKSGALKSHAGISDGRCRTTR